MMSDERRSIFLMTQSLNLIKRHLILSYAAICLQVYQLRSDSEFVGTPTPYPTECPTLVGIFTDIEFQNRSKHPKALEPNHPQLGILPEQLLVRFSRIDCLLSVSNLMFSALEH